jgi:hypothetical protein
MMDKKTSSKKTSAASAPKSARAEAGKPSVKTGARTAAAAAVAIADARTVSDDEIAVRAYALWESRGRPFGSPGEDWYKARMQLCGG